MNKKNKKVSQKNGSFLTESKSSAVSQLQEVVQETKSDSITLLGEDALVLRTNEQNVLKAKLRLADIELAVLNFNKEKAELLSLINSEHEDFVANARKFAAKNGIDPDGDPSGDKWNLDTSTMVFHKLN